MIMILGGTISSTRNKLQFFLDKNHIKKNNLFLFTLATTTFFALLFPFQSAVATSISFDTTFVTGVSDYTQQDIAIITIDDSTNPVFITNNQIDTISITETTDDPNTVVTLESIDLLLTETGPNTGIFKSGPLIFSTSHTKFPLNSVVTITQNEINGIVSSCPGGNFIDASVVDQICVSVSSTTSPGASGISFLTLTETGANTGTFVGNLKLSPFQTIAGQGQIKVDHNDVLSVSYLGGTTNAIIAPSTNNVGEILVDPCDGISIPCDDITVTYGSNVFTTDIIPGPGGGGGGGGLILPGLVLDFLYSLVNGGSPFIVQPPSFGGGPLHYSDGLTIVTNNVKQTFDISKYNQDIKKQVLVAGVPVNMTLKMYDSYNIDAIIHSGLYLIPSGSDMITPNSMASIVYDKGPKIEITDPTNLLVNASVTSSTDGKFQYVSFYFVPTRSYEKISFLNRAWNDHLYSTDVRFHDAAIRSTKLDIMPLGFTKYDNFHDLITLINEERFEKPQIMAHIHSGTDIFSSNEGGYVYWLYDSTRQNITLVISDKKGNILYSFTEPLIKKETQPKGDYGFMKFTVKQLNRWNPNEEQKVMEEEAIKAKNTN